MADAVLVSSSFLPGQGGIESYLAELCDHLKPRLAVVAAAERDGKPLPGDLGYPAYGFSGLFPAGSLAVWNGIEVGLGGEKEAETERSRHLLSLPGAMVWASPIGKRFGGKLLWPGRRAAQAVIEAARRERTDKVVFGTPWPLLLMAPRLAAAGLRYSVIVHGAEMLVPSKVPVVKRRLAEALAGAELLLPVSRFTTGICRTFLEAEKLVVPRIEIMRARVDLERFDPAADTESARRSLGIEDDEKVLLCFGRLVARKGVDRLIRIMPELARRCPGIALVIAGTGPEAGKLRRQAADTDVAAGRIVFAGRVPDKHTPGVYAMADVFAFPVVDRWFGLEIEGLGVVLLEAAACETPAVTGRSGGTPEAVINGGTGFVVDAADEVDLLTKIEWLLRHPDDARLMGKEGRKHVERNFSATPEAFLAWLSS